MATVLKVFLVCSFLSIHAIAQQPQSAPVILRATTRLVQISVIAQDKKGQPVPDLKKEDFEIKVKADSAD